VVRAVLLFFGVDLLVVFEVLSAGDVLSSLSSTNSTTNSAVLVHIQDPTTSYTALRFKQLTLETGSDWGLRGRADTFRRLRARAGRGESHLFSECSRLFVGGGVVSFCSLLKELRRRSSRMTMP
jgi:hypothetical protein